MRKLGVRPVWGYDVLYVPCMQCLPKADEVVRIDKLRYYENDLDELISHFRRHVDAFDIVLSGLPMFPLRGQLVARARFSSRLFFHSDSVPFFAGRGPPSKTMYGVIL